MAFLVELDFGAGFVDYTSSIRYENEGDITRTMMIHKELRMTTNTCDFMTIGTSALVTALMTNSADIPIRITKDAAPWFYGYVQRTGEVDVTHLIGDIKLTAYDPSTLLDKKLAATYLASDASVTTIVNALLAAAGCTSNIGTIANTIDSVAFPAGEGTYWEAIEGILSDFGYVLYFDAAGVAQTFDLFPASVASTDDYISGEAGNMLGALGLSRKQRRYGGCKVTYFNHKTISNAKIFNDTTGAVGNYDCYIDLAGFPRGYPDREDADDVVYCDYAHEEGEIVACEGVTHDIQGSSITVSTFTNHGKRAAVKVTGAGYITRMAINAASAIVKSSAVIKESLTSGLSEPSEEYNAEYIVNASDADRLVSGRKAYWINANVGYRWKSYDAPTLGAIVGITDASLGITEKLCTIVAFAEDGAGLYDITAEAAEAYSAADIVSVGVVPPSPVLEDTIEAVREASIRMRVSSLTVIRDRAGIMTPDAITLVAFYGYNNSSYAGRFQVEVSTDGATYATAYQSASDEATYTYEIPDTYEDEFIVLMRFRLYKAGGFVTLKEETVVSINMAVESIPVYWGALTSAPATGFLANDFYFDNNNVAGGGGKIRYYTGTSWAEATSAWGYFSQANAAAMSDMIAWTNLYGEDLIAAVTAMITSLSAQTAFISTLFAQQIEVPSGGSQRWYDGIGVQRRCIEIKNGKLSFLSAPDTTPPTAETLQGVMGQVGNGENILVDGNFVVTFESYWSAASTINAAASFTPAYILLASNELRIAYARDSDDYIVERIWDGSAWGAESVVNNAASIYPTYIQLEDGELRIAYRRNSDNYLVERVWNGSSWDAESVINSAASGYMAYGKLANGELRIAYQRVADGYIVERIWGGAAWGAESVVNNATSISPSYAQLDTGELRIIYSRDSDDYIVERIWSGSAWGAESVINNAASISPVSIKTLDGSIRLAYRRNADNYIVERILENGGWGAEAVINASTSLSPAYVQLIDGSLRLAYIASTNVVERTLRRYARLGAGVTDEGVSTDGRSWWEKKGNNRIHQEGWTYITGDGTDNNEYVTVTLPVEMANYTGLGATVIGVNTGNPTAIDDTTSATTGAWAAVRILSSTQISVGGLGRAAITSGARILIAWWVNGTPV